ncbi:MAG: uroporphyrinogen decarboxylase family protein [Planctomycetia bacterium]|nr:uroporphyrinogen decarboxylase family protein [Planctomycetia bacterium]
MPMTSRERVECALRHKEPDRTPIFEYVLQSPVADAILGRPLAEGNKFYALGKERGWEEAVRQLAIDRLDLAQILGHDMLYVTPVWAPAGDESQQPRPEPTDDPVANTRAMNDWSRHQPPTHDDHFLIYVCLKEEMNARGMDLPICAPAYGHGVWNDVDLMQTMLIDAEEAHRYFSLATKRELARIDKYIALGIDQIGVGGDFAGNRPMISPAAYREFIVPEVRELSRHIHNAGARAINTSDGNLWSVIEDFLFACEVDGYLEMDFHAGMDLRKLKRLYGDRITFYGNLDCGNVLSFGSADDIRRHTRECIEAGWGNGGHILTTSNAITASVPLENYLLVVETYREMFRLPELELNL